MTIKEILNCTQHRPWEIPAQNWKFYQEWNNAIFLHWQVDLQELEQFVPKELEIDLFEGKAWVSVVAFTMEKIRPKYLPYFSPISNFHEVNVRTYIKSDNKTGVYFLSIEGGTELSCKIARKISALPYRYSQMKRTSSEFISTNVQFDDMLTIKFVIENDVSSKEPLDKWLTERYALFQDTKTAINEFEIQHIEWPVKDVEITWLDFDYPRFANLINGSPDKTQYSTGVQVIAWDKKTIRNI